MRFEWDPKKERSNRSKHGIGFSLATLIFNDPNILSRLDERTGDGERRWNSIGIPVPESGAPLHVTHTVKEDEGGEEVIRIISTRKATKNERALYFGPLPGDEGRSGLPQGPK